MKKRLSTLALGLGVCGVAFGLHQPKWLRSMVKQAQQWTQEMAAPAPTPAPKPLRVQGPNGKPLPVPVTAAGPTTFCAGDSVMLEAPAGYDHYLWSNGATTRTIWVKDAGNYTVRVAFADLNYSDTLAGFTDSGVTLYPVGATDTDSVWLFVNPNVTCPTNATGLTGATQVRLHAGLQIGGNNFQNVVPANDNNPNSPTRFNPWGNWWVKGLRATDYFGATAGQASALTFVLTGDEQNVGWFPKEGKRNDNGCQDFIMPYPVLPSAGFSPFAVQVSVLAAPATPTVTPASSNTFCEGGSVVLRASGGTPGSYVWSNGATTDSIVVTTSGTYSVRTGAGSCLSTASNDITVSVTDKPMPVPVTATGSTTFCQGDSVLLSAPAGYAEYLWSNGATTQTIYAKAAGRYTVRVASVAGGCLSDTLAGSFRSGVLVYPAGATANDSIYIWVDPSQTCPAGANGLVGTNVVRLHSGVTIGGNAFSNVVNTTDVGVEPQTRFMMSGSNLVKAILPRAYYGLAPGATPTALDFVLNGGAPAGTWFEREGKDATGGGCNDFKVALPVPNTPFESPFGVTVSISAPAAAPTVSASGPLTFCDGNSVTLRASGGAAGSYTWSTGATSDTLVVTSSGSYTVVSGTGACASAASTPVNVVVTPNNLPTPVITVVSGDTAGCAGQAVVLSAGAQAQGVGYIWSTGDTTETISVTASGSYTVVLRSGGCLSAVSAPRVLNLLAKPRPVMAIANGPTSVCDGDSVKLSAPEGYSAYLWSNGETTRTITVRSSGRFTVRVANANGCFSDTLSGFNRPGVWFYPANATENDSVYIYVNAAQTCPLPAANAAVSLAGANVVRLHSGATVNGQAWQSVVNTTDPAVEPRTRFERMGSWWVKAIKPRDYYGQMGTYQGLNFVLNGGAPAGGWFEREGKDEAANCGDYFVALPIPSVQAASPFGVDVVVAPAPATPVATANGPTTFCFGQTVILRASGGTAGSYVWSTGEQSDSLVVRATGSYSVRSIVAACTSAASTAVDVTVTEGPGINIMAMGNTSFCLGDSVTLVADTLLSPTQSYLWSNGATTRSIVARMSGDYSVRVFEAGCGSAASNVITVQAAGKPLPVQVMANGPTSICANDSVVLSAPGGYNFYRWSNGATTQNITVRTAGHYTVTVANAPGCFSDTLGGTMVSGVLVGPVGAMAGDSIIMMVDTRGTCPLPAANPAQSLEGANMVRLHSGATVGGNAWQNVVSTTDANVEPQTRFSLMGNRWVKALVPNQYYQMTGITGLNFVLNGGAPQGGWFEKEGKVEPGCGDFSITFPIAATPMQSPYGVTVTINNTPSQPGITVQGDSTFCFGGRVTLRATGGAAGSYVWSDNSTADTLVVTRTGTFTVRSVAGACSSTASRTVSITVTSSQAPEVMAMGDTTFCQGGSVVLSTPEVVGATYLWNNGATTREVTVSRAGMYNVRTFVNGCGSDSSRSIQVRVTSKPLPVPVIANGPTTACIGDSIRLSAPAGYSAYLWNTGANSQEIWVRTSGHYTVRVANAGGCFSDTLAGFSLSGVTVYPAGATADDSVYLFLDPRRTCPLPAANAAQSLGAAGLVRLHSGANINGTRWSNVVSTTDPVAELRTRFTAVGNWWVKPIMPRAYYGAGAAANISELCFVLNGGAPVGGWFEREGKVEPGCNDFFVPLPVQASAQPSPFGITINFVGAPSAPTVSPAGPAIVCDNSTLQLTASGTGRYIWSNGDTTQSINVRTAGDYSVRVITGTCTSAVSTPVTVTVTAAPVAGIALRNDSLIASPAGGTSYEWLLGGIPVLGANGATFIPTISGNYSVVVTVGGCRDTSNVLNVVSLATIAKANLSMYPNPANGEVYLLAPATWWTNATEVRVLNVLGREVLRAPARPDAEGRLTLATGELAAGTYQVVIPGTSFSRLLVIKH